MKPYIAIILLGFMSTTANAQSATNPGGVKGATHWYVTDMSNRELTFRSLVGTRNSLHPLASATSSVSWLNFHPAFVFTGTEQLPILLGSSNVNSASYFTVYQTTDTSDENHIWHITKNYKTGLVFTTKRMADLFTTQYMNYRDVVPLNPKVGSYVQNKEQDTIPPVDQIWYVGVRPTSPKLPIVSFKGLIPEIIAFDRALNGQERLKVASYLAMKYGVTLTEPEATYLNSSGEKIWDGWLYPSYHNNIAAIGRDDSSGLEQKMASSSNNPGLLTIATRNSLHNNTFLIWGDNGMPLTVADKIPGVPGLLQKRWLVVPHGISQSFTSEVIIDTKQIDAAVAADPVYWLAIDRSGTGDFSLPGTEFKKMNLLDQQGKAHFTGVGWNTNGAGKDVFGIIAGKDLLLLTLIDNPACATPDKGRLQVEVLGGNPPYQLTVVNHAGQLISQRSTTGDMPESVLGIFAGKYRLRVTDATQQVYTDSFYIKNTDGPKPSAVEKNYQLPEGSTLRINAAEGMQDGLSYRWTGPGNFQSLSPEVSLVQAGVYTLTCSKGGCANQQDVIVKTPPASVFNNITVYPNPSTGLFTVKISLDKPAQVSMAIYTRDAKLFTIKKMEGMANYTFTNELFTSGEYTLVFQSGLFNANRKLIIAK